MNNIPLNVYVKNIMKTLISSSHFLFALYILFISFLSNAETVSLGDKLNIASKILNEERSIVVHKPLGYDISKDHYAVVYLLDGDINLLHTAGIIDYLQRNQLMPKVILVAINNSDRVRDFTPETSKETKIKYNLPQMGGADKFLSFISDELKPALANSYRVAPYSILIGHSYGGILSIYSQQTKPSLFDAHIAVSPSIFFDERALVKSGKKVFEKKGDTPNFLYMTLANERIEFAESIEAYVNVLTRYAPKTMRWKFDRLPEETHQSSFHPAIISGLKLLFEDWYIKDISSLLENGNINNVKAHYQKLSMIFGYDIEPPNEMIIEAGFYFLSHERIDEAIAAFKINTLRYPHSGMAYFNLAQAYMASGQEDISKNLIYKACRIGKQYKEIDTGMFCHEANILGMAE